MAITIQSTTKEVQFNSVNEVNLLAVCKGVDTFAALSLAGALEGAVMTLLADAVQSSMSSDAAFLCEFGLQAASAMREAAGAVA